MNDFDTRLRDELRAFADTPEPPAYDPSALHRRAHRATRRALAVTAASAAAVLAVSLLGRTAIERETTPAGPPSTIAPAVPRFGHEVVDSAVPASGAEYANGLTFEAAKDDLSGRLVVKCVADGGGTLPRFDGPALGPSDLPISGDLPDLARVRREARFLSGRDLPGPPDLSAMSGRDRRLYDTCVRRVNGEFARLDQARAKLADPWWARYVRPVQRDPRVLALLPEMRACALRENVPNAEKISTESTVDAFSDFYGWLDGVTSRAAPGDDDTPLIRRTARAFVRCAGPPVRTLERILHRHQTAYLLAHPAEVQALISEATRTFTRLEATLP
ncbi:hypothetical protein GCM10027589_31100 [Actinocorallia lasiicapitis]